MGTSVNSLNHFMKSQPIRKLTQFFLSLSIFSFLYSPSSMLVFLHSFNFYFSALPFQLLKHTIDKNFLFLLSSGLLVFLSKYSGLLKFISESSYGDRNEPFRYCEDCSALQEPLMLEMENEEPMLEKEAERKQAIENKYVIEDVKDNYEPAMEEEEQIKDLKESVRTSMEEAEETEKETDKFTIDDEQQEDMEDNHAVLENGELTTEELNKKFDEFIRRMKEDLLIEARMQLAMV